MQRIKFWPFLFFVVVLSGCTLGPRYSAPQIDAPCEWKTTECDGFSNETADCFVWWESLNDPILTWLIEQAQCQNLDIQIAATRILEARLAQTEKQADLYPRLDGSLACADVYYNTDTLNQLLGRHNRHHGHKNLGFFEIGFDVDWELDLFGAKAHEICAMKAKLQATKASFYNVWVSLTAEIGKNYIELRSLQQRLEITKQNIASQQDTVSLTQELLDMGMGNTIDLQHATEQLYILKAQQPLLNLSINKAINRLSILLGYAPGDLCNCLSEICALPAIPCNKPIGVPSELLRRRPDIRMAERELAAATEQVGTAVASLFPRLSLRGFIGDISTSASSLFNGKNFTTFASPQLLMPIFNSKMLMTDVDYSKIKVKQALFEYQKTVLAALEETENAIAAFHFELERERYLALAQASDEETREQDLELYQKGFKSYLEVLVTNNALFAAQEAHIQSQTDLILHFIALYKSLGGGWVVDCCEKD